MNASSGGGVQPPSSGFKNIKPMTRKERRALKDKVALEKQRLMNRTGLAVSHLLLRCGGAHGCKLTGSQAERSRGEEREAGGGADGETNKAGRDGEVFMCFVLPSVVKLLTTKPSLSLSLSLSLSICT